MRKSKTLRLHRQHDLDLITLYRSSGFSFSKEVRAILVAYVKGDQYAPPVINYDNVDLSYIPTTIQYHLTLDPNDPDEKAVLDMLHDEIKYGYVNSFIKAIIRSYIPYIPLIGYGNGNGFVTRRINAVDVGKAIRLAAKEEIQKVKADKMDVSEIIIKTESSVNKEELENMQPEALETKEPVTEFVANETVKENSINTDSDDANDVDASFDDFMSMAEAFTGA